MSDSDTEPDGVEAPSLNPSPNPLANPTLSSLPKSERVRLRKLKRLMSKKPAVASAKAVRRPASSLRYGTRVPRSYSPLEFLAALPSPFLVFPLFTSSVLYFLSDFSPHSTGSYTEVGWPRARSEARNALRIKTDTRSNVTYISSFSLGRSLLSFSSTPAPASRPTTTP